MLPTATMRRLLAERLSGFAYGTVGAIVALSGMEHGQTERAWWKAALSVVLGGVAVWLAHTYSHLLGARIEAGRDLRMHEFAHAMRESWPMVTASALVASPLALAGLELLSFESAALAARGVGVVVLSLVGLLAPGQRWTRRLLLATASAAAAIGIVAFELAV